MREVFLRYNRLSNIRGPGKIPFRLSGRSNWQSLTGSVRITVCLFAPQERKMKIYLSLNPRWRPSGTQPKAYLQFECNISIPATFPSYPDFH